MKSEHSGLLSNITTACHFVFAAFREAVSRTTFRWQLNRIQTRCTSECIHDCRQCTSYSYPLTSRNEITKKRKGQPTMLFITCSNQASKRRADNIKHVRTASNQLMQVQTQVQVDNKGARAMSNS